MTPTELAHRTCPRRFSADLLRFFRIFYRLSVDSEIMCIVIDFIDLKNPEYISLFYRCHANVHIPVTSGRLFQRIMFKVTFWSVICLSLGLCRPAGPQNSYQNCTIEPVFTARCTLVQSAVLRSHVVCPSVRPSVTLVNCDHIGWNPSKIISRSVSLGCSLFATQTSRVYSKGNTLEFSPE